MPPFTTTKQEAERLGAPATGQGRTAAARDRNPPKPTTCPKSKAQTLPKPPKTARHDVTVPQRGAGQGGTLPARRNTPGAPRPPRATLRQSGARCPPAFPNPSPQPPAPCSRPPADATHRNRGRQAAAARRQHSPRATWPRREPGGGSGLSTPGAAGAGPGRGGARGGGHYRAPRPALPQRWAWERVGGCGGLGLVWGVLREELREERKEGSGLSRC